MSGNASSGELTLIGIKLVGEACEQSSDGLNSVNISLESSTSGFSSSYSGAHRKLSLYQGDILGFVALPAIDSVSLRDFREKMREQVRYLPDNYFFLSKERWPVSSLQELTLTIHHVIATNQVIHIRSQYEKPRFGVQMDVGCSLGFIFCEMTSKATAIRELISEELSPFLPSENFTFLDKNRWPVSVKQETVLNVLDLVNNGVFTIRGVKRCNSFDDADGRLRAALDGIQDTEEGGTLVVEPDISDGTDEEPSTPTSRTKRPKMPCVDEGTDPEYVVTQHRNSTPREIELVVAYPPDIPPVPLKMPLDLSRSPPATDKKPILISYVRAEAEQHARRLKIQLNDLGCNVFLDIDEIRGGHDWQDKLNNAVRNCAIFVPLITPQYGLTQWTNREVKLADMMSKLIIPINFLDYWPPECLAIQFASTQYLPWKMAEEIKDAIETEGSRATDIRHWDEPFITRSASQIYNICYQKQPRSGSLSEVDGSGGPNSPETEYDTGSLQPKARHDARRNLDVIQAINTYSGAGHTFRMMPQIVPSHESVLNSVPGTSWAPPQTSIPEPSFYAPIKPQPPRQPLVVITAHPKQRDFVSAVRTELSKLGLEVWSSTDMAFGSTASGSSDSCLNRYACSSPTPLTPVVTYSLPAYPVTSSDSISGTSDQTTMPLMDNSSQDSQSAINSNLINGKYKRPSFKFSLSQVGDSNVLGSQCSEFGGSQNSIFSPEDLDKAKVFRERVDQARVVIMVMSSDYVKSQTCKRQAYYCDYRKTVIGIKYDDCPMPHCLTKVLDKLIHRQSSRRKSKAEGSTSIGTVVPEAPGDFLRELKQRVQSILGSREQFRNEMKEASIMSMVSHLSKRLPYQDKTKIFVYVAGSSKFFNSSSEAICRAIGHTLAQKENIVLVTGGWYGAAESVGRSFCEERSLPKSHPVDEDIYHILPRYDPEDCSMKARHRSDGTFEKVPFGKTEFIGETVQERDSIVARMFNYCILIEGGRSSARVAQEFIWNGHIVIPIMCTGGAANGKLDTEMDIKEMPAGVNENDWRDLSRRDVTAEQVAEALVHVIYSLYTSKHSKGPMIISKKYAKPERERRGHGQSRLSLDMSPFRVRSKSHKSKARKQKTSHSDP